MLSVKRRGGTVLIVSHRRRILKIADFVIQIKDGRLVQHRTGQEFVSQQQQSRDFLRALKSATFAHKYIISPAERKISPHEISTDMAHK